MSKTIKSILTSVLYINEGWWIDQLALVIPIIEMKGAGVEMNWFLSRWKMQMVCLSVEEEVHFI